MSRDELIEKQKTDSTLVELFDRVVSYDRIESLSSGYYLDEELLVWKWVPQGEFAIGDPMVQIVIPQSLRQLVLQTAHDASGHMGVKKTYKLPLKRFFWPKLKGDVSKYIKSCYKCQLTGEPSQSLKPAPLYPIPAISQPFEPLVVDCVGGIPQVVQSDHGSNFTSNLFGQVLKQLHVQHNLSRFHQTLKSLLRSYCVQMGKDWETGLPWLMMAALEAAQESTGFKWEKSDPSKNVLSYVSDFRRLLYEANQLATASLHIRKD